MRVWKMRVWKMGQQKYSDPPVDIAQVSLQMIVQIVVVGDVAIHMGVVIVPVITSMHIHHQQVVIQNEYSAPLLIYT